MKQHLDDVKIYEERLENLKQQLIREREKTTKKSNREISEVNIISSIHHHHRLVHYDSSVTHFC